MQMKTSEDIQISLIQKKLQEIKKKQQNGVKNNPKIRLIHDDKVKEGENNNSLVNRLSGLVIMQIDKKSNEICVDFRNRLSLEIMRLKNDFLEQSQIQLSDIMPQWEQKIENIDLNQIYENLSSSIIKQLNCLYQKVSDLPEWKQNYDPETDLLVPDQKISCLQCSLEFNNLIQLNQHNHDHNDDLIECHQCYKQFQNQKNLIQHLEIRHNISYYCKQCHLKFFTPIDLWLHNQIYHSNNIFYHQLKCKYCMHQNQNQKALRKHILINHLDDIQNEYQQFEER